MAENLHNKHRERVRKEFLEHGISDSAPEHKLLEMLLFTFRMSGVNLERQATLNIIVHETMARDINFLRLKNFSDKG